MYHLTFDDNVAQETRDSVSEKFESIGWFVLTHFVSTSPNTAVTDFYELSWMQDTTPEIPELPVGCHLQKQ